MIFRVQGAGQFCVPLEMMPEIERLERSLADSVKQNNGEAFSIHLKNLDRLVIASGERLPDDLIVESDIILPPIDATIEETRAVLIQDGLLTI